MLTGQEILRQRALGNIVIEPFNPECVNPNSYNITLNSKIMYYTQRILDPRKENKTKTKIIPERGYVLKPGRLYLGSTNEYTETYGMVPCIDGRSSIGRLGLFIHVTAGFGDNGFNGKWTLEFMPAHRIRIYPNMPIGQLYYELLQGEQTYYKGRYDGQMEVTPSRFYKTENGNKQDYTPTFEK